MVKGFFVTGTDTGVGKTLVAAALARRLRAEGIRAGAMKPIETGCELVDGELRPSDGLFLRSACEMTEDLSSIVPFRFEAPVAPLVASDREGRPVDVQVILKEFERLASAYDTLLVEGVGGILIPITQDYFVVDLAKELGLPLIVVATPFLGTINHTLLQYATRPTARCRPRA